MYHEKFHPLAGKNLKNILQEYPDAQEKILEQVNAANEKETRKYRVEIDEDRWFEVDNGQVISSSNN